MAKCLLWYFSSILVYPHRLAENSLILPQAEELMSGNTKFRWFLKTSIVIAIFFVATISESVKFPDEYPIPDGDVSSVDTNIFMMN
jgi:hypothetical protein